MTPLSVAPIRPKDVSNLRDLAYRHLRDAILSGGLESGAQLNERELALALGVSTTPVKDALRRLEIEGLTVTLPRRGSFVAHFPPQLRHELALIRAALEGVAARLAAEQVAAGAPAGDVAAALADIQARGDAAPPVAIGQTNARFHAAICRLADSDYLARLLDGLMVFDQASRRDILGTENEPRQALAEHTSVASAILGGDGEAAERAMRAHVLRSAGIQPNKPTRTGD